MLGSRKLIPLAYIIILIYFAFTVIPYAWLFLTSLKQEIDSVKLPIEFLPNPATLKNYIEDLDLASGSDSLGISIGSAFFNSVIIAFASTFLAMVIGLPAAYSFAKYQFRGGKVIFLLILVTRMFPVIALAIPFYKIFNMLGLEDNKLGLILAYTSLTLPFVIWMMYGFFSDIPNELENAAQIDGCNFFQMFSKIILPISTPGIATTFVLTLIYPWNDLLLNSILSSTPNSQTLPSALSQFNTGTQLFWGHLSAGSIIASLPILIFTLFSQRYIVQGLTMGSVKE